VNTEVQTGYRKKLLPSEEGPAATQVAQKCCAVSVLGGCQDLTA